MARYSCSYRVQVSLDRLPPLMDEILQGCNFEVIYQTSDYLMAKEIPGQVAFAKLVTIEVLIDSTQVTFQEVPITLMVKNDELPLQHDNHCRQCFDRVCQAISENYQEYFIVRTSV